MLNYILCIEILLMTAFLTMNAADYKLQALHFGDYIKAGNFPVSNLIRAAYCPTAQAHWLLSSVVAGGFISAAFWLF